MPIVRALQSTFNAGVVDPLLASRVDLAQYYRGMRVGRNVIVSPRGGVRRRGGTLALGELPQTISRITSGITATAPEGGTAGNANDGSTGTSVISTTPINALDPYVLIHYDLGSAKTITFADAVGLSMSGSSTDEWAIQFSDDNSTWYTLQGALGTIDTVASTHRRTGPVTARYWRVAKVGGTTVGAVTATLQEFNLWEQSGTYGNAVLAEFAFNVDQVYMLAFTDYNIDVYRSGVYQVSLRSPYSSAALEEITFTQSVDVILCFHKDVRTQQLSRYTDTDWQFSGISFSNIPQYNFGSGAEDVISTTRGWARCGTFHEGRLYMGGLRSRPASILASKTNSFYDLDEGTGLDDEGFLRTLDTDQLNAIQYIVSGQDLQIYTSGDVFYCPSSPITPANVAFQSQSVYGCAAIKPVKIDNAALYMQYNSDVLHRFLYDFGQDSYVAMPTTLTAGHLIENPVTMAAIQGGTTEDDSNYVMVINEDGSVAVYNTLSSEEVSAWTDWTTDGNFKAVAAVESDLYFVVQRTLNGGEAWFIELYDEATYTDCALQGTESPATDTITGLDHLDGEECRVRGDGAVLANVTPSSGSVTLEHSVEEWEIGLDWQPEVQTMPLNMDFQNGPTFAEMKRLVRAVLYVNETLGLIVNGRRIADRQFGAVLNTAPIPYTGEKEIWLSGWDREGVVTITQEDPVPMNILGIMLEVEA
jgi:hypothetical protein